MVEPSQDPALDAYFERGSALGLLRRGHPYDFAETYTILREAYGYRSYAVNLGLWTTDAADEGALDPGQRLVRFLARRAGLAPGAHVLDVGSGLGQGALELAQALKAAAVVGVNINRRQIAFANALALARGESARVQHHDVDACAGLRSAFPDAPFDAAFAVECLGHFAEPRRFFADLHAVLRPGAPFVACLNVARGALPPGFRAMLRASYGFVPRPLDVVAAELATAGFDVDTGDITAAVLGAGMPAVQARLRDPAVRAHIPVLARVLVTQQLALSARAVAAGRLGYAWILARRRGSSTPR